MAILVSCLLGSMLNGDTCFFKHSRYLSIHLAVSSRATRRLRLSSTATHWLSSILGEGELCCVFRFFSGSGGSFCHFSLVLNFMPLILPTFLRCCLLTRTLQPSSSACHEVVLLVCSVKEAGKYYCLLSSSTSRCTLERPLHFLAPSSAPRPQCPLLYGRHYPSNSPLPP